LPLPEGAEKISTLPRRTVPAEPAAQADKDVSFMDMRVFL